MNNQRCLYFDKNSETVVEGDQSSLEKVEAIQELQREIQKKEAEIEVINDAGKTTADQMMKEAIHIIPPYYTKRKKHDNESKLSKTKDSSILDILTGN